MALARADADAGDAAAGVVRLRRFGDDGRLMRGGRLLLAQLEAERGQLEVADGVLTAASNRWRARRAGSVRWWWTPKPAIASTAATSTPIRARRASVDSGMRARTW